MSETAFQIAFIKVSSLILIFLIKKEIVILTRRS